MEVMHIFFQFYPINHLNLLIGNFAAIMIMIKNIDFYYFYFKSFSLHTRKLIVYSGTLLA